MALRWELNSPLFFRQMIINPYIRSIRGVEFPCSAGDDELFSVISLL